MGGDNLVRLPINLTSDAVAPDFEKIHEKIVKRCVAGGLYSFFITKHMRNRHMSNNNNKKKKKTETVIVAMIIAILVREL